MSHPSAPARPVGVPRPAGGVPCNLEPGVICFGCGQKGHYSTECPNKKNVAPRPNAPAPARGNPGRNNAPCGASNAAKGCLNHVQAEEAQEAAYVILGTFSVNLVPAQVLFDSGASHSFVTASFVNRSGMRSEPMRRFMSVQIPGSRVKAFHACYGVPIDIQGVMFPAELIVLGTEG